MLAQCVPFMLDMRKDMISRHHIKTSGFETQKKLC